MKTLTAIVLLAAGTVLYSCQKQTNLKENAPPKSEQVAQRTPTSKLDYFKLLAEKVLQTATNSLDFKKMVYTECFAEYQGDYYITIKHLITKNEELKNEGVEEFWNPEDIAYIEDILQNITSIDEEAGEESTEPTIFVPFVEDIDIDALLEDCPSETPEAVIALEYNTEGGAATCPAYTLSDEVLVPNNNDVAEDYAWTNDVWVFNQEEVLTSDNMEAGTEGQEAGRVNGQSERGGIIQVLNMGALERWIDGKFEFRFFVFNASGTKTNEIALGKQKRKHFRNQKWTDFNKFLFNWNTPNIGNWTIEAWIEEDGGGSSTTVSTTIPSSCTGCPSTTVSYTKQSKDYALGQSLIQFSDPITTAYSLSHANIKRKN